LLRSAADLQFAGRWFLAAGTDRHQSGSWPRIPSGSKTQQGTNGLFFEYINYVPQLPKTNSN